MALPDVLRANEVLLNGERWRVPGGVQVALISVFPPKVVTGDFTRATEQVVSSHTFADWSGGMLVKRMDPTTQANRSWRPQIDTRIPKQATTLLQTLSITTDQPANTTPGVAMFAGGTLYVGFNDTTGSGVSVVRSTSNGSNWSTPAGVADSDAGTTWTDVVDLRLGSTDWLVFAFGASGVGGYVQWNGSTWTNVTGDDSAIPRAAYLAEWDGRLWALTATQNRLWVTSDLSTWTAKAVIPQRAGEVTKLVEFFNAEGDPSLLAVTRTGVWIYDATNDKWYRTRFRWPYHRRGGEGVAVWQDGNLYLSVGTTVYAFDGRTVRSVGLDREDGLADGYQGDVVRLLNGFRWLYAGTTGLDGTNLGSVFAYDGVGWHLMRIPTGSVAHPLAYGPIGLGAANHLVFSESGVVRFLTFPDGSINPLENRGYRFHVGTNSLDTPWFDANWQELSKLAVGVDVAVENADSDDTWALYYAIDNNESYDVGGMTALATGQTSTFGALAFGAGAGIVFKRIRFKIVLTKATNAWPPQNVGFVTLKYLLNLPPRYSYSFDADLSEQASGYTPEEASGLLQAAVESGTLVSLQLLRDGQELVDRRVKISREGFSVQPGADGRIRASLTAIEV